MCVQLAWIIAFVSSIISAIRGGFPNFAWWTLVFMLFCIVGVTVTVASDAERTYHVAVSAERGTPVHQAVLTLPDCRLPCGGFGVHDKFGQFSCVFVHCSLRGSSRGVHPIVHDCRTCEQPSYCAKCVNSDRPSTLHLAHLLTDISDCMDLLLRLATTSLSPRFRRLLRPS